MKRVALTVGDPAGIGPEIVLKALASPERPVARSTNAGHQRLEFAPFVTLQGREDQDQMR